MKMDREVEKTTMGQKMGQKVKVERMEVKEQKLNKPYRDGV